MSYLTSPLQARCDMFDIFESQTGTNFGHYMTSTPCRYFCSLRSRNIWQGLQILPQEFPKLLLPRGL